MTDFDRHPGGEEIYTYGPFVECINNVEVAVQSSRWK